MTYFVNCREEFASLSAGEFPKQWNDVSIDELDISEADIINGFHAAASPDGSVGFNPNKVLLAMGEGGFLKDVYAASLKQAEDDETGIVIKLGGMVYPVTIDESERTIGKGAAARVIKEQIFVCGALFGAIAFDDKEKSIKDKVDGKEVEITYTPCWIDFSDANGDAWRVPISLNLSLEPDKPKVLNAIADGSIASLLRPVKSGAGGDTVGMETIGEGVFPVESYRTVETKNGERFIIMLQGGQEVWSRGGADKTLSSDTERAKLDAALGAGVTVNLAIGNIQVKQTKDGQRTYLDCALRWDRKAVSAAAPVAALPVTPVLPELPPTAAVGAVADSTRVVDYEEIPF